MWTRCDWSERFLTAVCDECVLHHSGLVQYLFPEFISGEPDPMCLISFSVAFQ